MLATFLPYLAIIAGLALLIWSADRFVTGSVGLALNLGMTPMMVGLTVVAFGTSAPELIVSGTAAWEGAGNLAVGNALGSNIANIGLVLGITALISPIPVRTAVLRVEFPVLLIVSMLAATLFVDGRLNMTDGVILLSFLAIAMTVIARMQPEAVADIDEISHGEHPSTAKALLWVILGLTLLLVSSKILVWGAIDVARSLGVSELVIGLTVIAIGTSLPELAASIASALKGHHDLALGNVIGSNLFNLLAVLAIPALIDPPEFEDSVFYRDYSTMLAFTFGLAIIAYITLARSKPALGRLTGTILVLGYAAYLSILYVQST